jgi:fido (protein-threonine AMPylation protein)
MFRAFEVLLDLIGRALSWWDTRKAQNEGRAMERRESAAVVVQETKNAEIIREGVRDAVAADDNELRRDDGFKRPN